MLRRLRFLQDGQTLAPHGRNANGRGQENQNNRPSGTQRAADFNKQINFNDRQDNEEK